MLAGTAVLIWYTPTIPGTRPEKDTRRGVPPRDTVGIAKLLSSGLAVAAAPETAEGDVWPKPVAKIKSVSPAWIGLVELTSVLLDAR